jgi:hypothetical protein
MPGLALAVDAVASKRVAKEECQFLRIFDRADSGARDHMQRIPQQDI